MQLGIAQQSLDLSGIWTFQLDDEKVGERERWFEKDLEESISLPGSTRSFVSRGWIGTPLR